MDFCTKMRLPAEQTSPWLMNTPKSAPSMAASKSASPKKMLGDLPPSSRVTRFTVSAAAVIFEAGCDVGHVVFGLDDRLACVAALQFSQHGQVLAAFFGKTKKHATTLLRGGRGPWTLFKRGFSSGDSAIYVFGIRVGNL